MSIPVIFPATPQGNLRHVNQKLQQNYNYTHNSNNDLFRRKLQQSIPFQVKSKISGQCLLPHFATNFTDVSNFPTYY